MEAPRRPSPALRTGFVLVWAGFVAGALAYALVGADRANVPAQVQSLMVVGIGAITTGLVAASAAYWAATIAAQTAAREGEASRLDARTRSRLDEKTAVVRRIAVLANRHAQEVADQVARRQKLAGKPYEPLPTVNPTTPVEDAVNELYSIGFQQTADVAQALFNCLTELDRFCFEATPASMAAPIPPLTSDDHTSFLAWRETQKRMKTHMMDVGLRDPGTDRLAPEGTLPRDFLWREYIMARADVERPAFVGTISPSTSTSPPG